MKKLLLVPTIAFPYLIMVSFFNANLFDFMMSGRDIYNIVIKYYFKHIFYDF